MTARIVNKENTIDIITIFVLSGRPIVTESKYRIATGQFFPMSGVENIW